MNKAVKGFLTGLALTAVVLAPACKSKPKKVDDRPIVVPTDTAPTVTIPPNDTAARVQPSDDFVKPSAEPGVRSETLPKDAEELNRFVQERGLIRDAFFEYAEAALSADAQAALTTSANWLKANGAYNLLIEGHCDERGTEQYNLALGDKRAQQAKDYLVTSGVDASRIRIVSYGEERPFDPGHDESAWSQNRRAHLVLVGR
jgi:peptidoglycan-associated lipoprotein